jgi:hypothetical protein
MAQLVRDGSAEDGQEPNHAAENSRERPGLLRGEIEFFLKIEGEGGKRAVVGKALEDFRDVGDPEGALEAVADFLEPLAKAHDASGDARRDDSRGKVCRRRTLAAGEISAPQLRWNFDGIAKNVGLGGVLAGPVDGMAAETETEIAAVASAAAERTDKEQFVENVLAEASSAVN